MPQSQLTDDELNQRVSEILAEMTTEEKVGQLFMVYWSSNNLTYSLEELISDYKVGSVYISGRNFGNSEFPTAAEQVASLNNQLQTYAWEHNQKVDINGSPFFLPLFLATDHEGDGPRLTRIRTGMTDIPSALAIGATWSTGSSEQIGEIVGRELNSIGINMLLGPVLDVLDQPDISDSGNLDTRVFGGNPHWVGELGRAYIRGIHQGGNGQVVTVSKHFPGHGDSNRATDRTVAITGKTRQELIDVDLIPFLRVTEFDSNDIFGVTDAIMSSHIAIEDTGNVPISLYYDINEQKGGLEKIFEEVEGFNDWHNDGFVVSDSLGVGAIRNGYLADNTYDYSKYKLVAREAFLSGNDLLILHNFYPLGMTSDILEADEIAHNIVKEISQDFTNRYETDPRFAARIDESVRKIVKAKLRIYPNPTINSVTVDLSDVSNSIYQKENQEIIDHIAQNAIALIKPSSILDLPSPPSVDDNILFITHDFEVPNCSRCGEEWQERTPEVFITDVTQ